MGNRMNPLIADYLASFKDTNNPLLTYNPLLGMQSIAPQMSLAPQTPPVPAMTLRAPQHADLSLAPQLYKWQTPTAREHVESGVAQGPSVGPAGGPVPVAAGGEPGPFGAVLNSLLTTESGGNWGADNGIGYVGRLQFGTERLADAANALGLGTIDKEAFKNDPALQRRVEDWHFSDIDRRINAAGLDRYIGQVVGGVPVTRSGMIAMAHLGGFKGMKRFLETGGAYNPSDANGTSLSDYGTIHAQSTQEPMQPAQSPPQQTETAMAATPTLADFVSLLTGNSAGAPSPQPDVGGNSFGKAFLQLLGIGPKPASQAPTAPISVSTAGQTEPAQTPPAQDDLTALMPDMSPEAQRREKVGTMLSALGVGLGQMSHGAVVDVSTVVEQHRQRQAEMQQRVAEIMMERRRRFERAQNRGWTVEDAQADAAAAAAQAEAKAAAEAAAAEADRAFRWKMQEDEQAAAAEKARVNAGYDAAEVTKASEDKKQANVATAKAALDGLADSTDPADVKRRTVLAGVIAAGGQQDPNDALKAAGLATPSVSNTTVFNPENTGTKLALESGYKSLDELRTRNSANRAIRGQVALLLPKLTSGELSTGVEDELLFPVRQWAAALNFIDPTLVDDQALLGTVTNAVAPTFHQEGAGASSDLDLQGYIKASPSKDKPEMLNAMLLSSIDKRAAADLQKADALAAWLQDSPENAGGFEADWNKKRAAGDAQQDFYMVNEDNVDSTLRAIDNGFLKAGDPIILESENGTDIFVLTDDYIDALRNF